MAAGSRVSAEKRHHNNTAIVKDHVFVNFLVLPDTLLKIWISSIQQVVIASIGLCLAVGEMMSTLF